MILFCRRNFYDSNFPDLVRAASAIKVDSDSDSDGERVKFEGKGNAAGAKEREAKRNKNALYARFVNVSAAARGTKIDKFYMW